MPVMRRVGMAFGEIAAGPAAHFGPKAGQDRGGLEEIGLAEKYGEHAVRLADAGEVGEES